MLISTMSYNAIPLTTVCSPFSCYQAIYYIKSKLVMPAKQLQVNGNIKSITPLWDRRQLDPTCKDILHTCDGV